MRQATFSTVSGQAEGERQGSSSEQSSAAHHRHAVRDARTGRWTRQESVRTVAHDSIVRMVERTEDGLRADQNAARRTALRAWDRAVKIARLSGMATAAGEQIAAADWQRAAWSARMVGTRGEGMRSPLETGGGL